MIRGLESSPSPFEGERVYHKVVRLKTGEAILCTMHTNVSSIASESFLTLHNPVQAILNKQMTKGEHIVGEIFILRPWIGISGSSEFVIPTDIVLTIGDLKSSAKTQYEDYLRETMIAEKILQREEEEESMNRAIYTLLSEVNPGRKVLIMKDTPDA